MGEWLERSESMTALSPNPCSNLDFNRKIANLALLVNIELIGSSPVSIHHAIATPIKTGSLSNKHAYIPKINRIQLYRE